ncbi:MAG: hypothetical protein ABW221_21125 [Vicinamibacteria bacterium]
MRIAAIAIAFSMGAGSYAQESPQTAATPEPAAAVEAAATATAGAPVASAALVAPVSRIPGTVFVESDQTLDASNSRDKAKYTDFGIALRGALIKKEVPVKVVTDPAKAAFTIRSTSSHREDSTGTKIAKIAFFGGGSFGQFQGSVEVIDNDSSAVAFAYNVKKGNYQSAAEAFAKHYKNYLAKQPR